MASLKESISGNLGVKTDKTESAFFKRKIKSAGRGDGCAKELKYRPFAKAGGDNS